MRTALIIDLGSFTALCGVFVDAGYEVFYYSPGADQSCPKIAPLFIGKEITGVTRVNDPWEVLGRCMLPNTDPDFLDYESLLVCFPDVGQGMFQHSLRGMGFRVWGSAMAAELELDRIAAKTHFGKIGMPIGEYDVLTGISGIKEYLADHPKKWVKVPMARGDWESTFAADLASIETQIDEFALKTGPAKETIQFIAEEPIEDFQEIAYDLYSVDGRYPSVGLCGVEVKGKCWLGKAMPYEKLPEQLRLTNSLIAPDLEAYRCRSWFGMEMGIDEDGRPYVIDPLARFGIPPSEACQLLITNLPDVMWEGAAGNLVDPKMVDVWAAELLILAEHWAEDHWTNVNYPASLTRHVRLQRQYGRHWVAPGAACVGAIVATGPSAKKACEACKQIAGQITGSHAMVIDEASLDKALESLAKLSDIGITL